MSFGISPDLKYYEFELDSYDATQAYQSNTPSTDWPLFKVGGKRPLENIAAMKIIEVEIPFTWYTLNSGNNTFVLEEYGFAPKVVTLTWSPTGVPLVPAVGNFSAGNMTGAYVNGVSGLLTNSLNRISLQPNPPGPLGSGYTYVTSYDPITQKISIWDNAPKPSPSYFKLYFGAADDTGNTNPRFLLGFNGGVISSSEFTGLGNRIIAPNVIQITGPNYLYLNSQKFGNLTDLYLPSGAKNLYGGNSGPQIARIPITCDPGGVIFWRDPDTFKYFDLENLGSLTELDFYLSLGNLSTELPLRLNGANFSVKFALLENTHTHNNTFASTAENGRVVKRVRIG
jgi:hypothetical protein